MTSQHRQPLVASARVGFIYITSPPFFRLFYAEYARPCIRKPLVEWHPLCMDFALWLPAPLRKLRKEVSHANSLAHRAGPGACPAASPPRRRRSARPQHDTDEVLRYDGSTGAFLGAFVSAGSGGLDDPTGLAFGPDGNLYVGSFFDRVDQVLRYDGATGAFLDAFVSAGSGGVDGAQA